jgi:hypothetical protein
VSGSALSFWSPEGPAMSKVRVDWNTPQNIVDLVHDFFGGSPDVDPCSNPNSIVGARRDYQLERGENGLAVDWQKSFFLNPPYGTGVLNWVIKAANQAAQGATGLGLMPQRTDSRWGQYVLAEARAVCFLRGRVMFVGAESPAPFPCMVPMWDRGNAWATRFVEVFTKVGVVMVRP